ncbi:unnamed protein product [Paramecium octaurelia]|uniref:Uncharacterized protein n=1 Tax=Paramecium octaurelia TaxID=43137 RepID=A0A8S1WNK8_PAROT|nr:unnamed protein product [Paramecium octaurelia]
MLEYKLPQKQLLAQLHLIQWQPLNLFIIQYQFSSLSLIGIYLGSTYGQEIIAVLYFNLDQIKTVNMVEYPKISEILADTGSIISWILSISCIVSKYNENLSVEKTQKDIITMYYHDFNDFIIQKNWMGHIIKVNYKGKEYDLKKSEEIINKLDTIAIKKMNYLNLQNEVAKLQLILQEHLGVQQIKKYLQSQYKLESLFDKLGIPDINYQSSLNQILPQIDEQLVQNSQIQPEILNDSTNNKDKTLALELQERMQILDLQVHQNPTASIFSND